MKTIFRFFTGILIFLCLTIAKDLVVQASIASVQFLFQVNTANGDRVATIPTVETFVEFSHNGTVYLKY